MILLDDFLIDKDTSAIFANDDFLVGADVELVLRRNLVEAATAGITLYANHGKTVSDIFAYTLVSHQQTFLDHAFTFLGTLQQCIFLFLSTFNDSLKFRPFLIEIKFAVIQA